jgi:hypothetical protein
MTIHSNEDMQKFAEEWRERYMQVEEAISRASAAERTKANAMDAMARVAQKIDGGVSDHVRRRIFPVSGGYVFVSREPGNDYADITFWQGENRNG